MRDLVKLLKLLPSASKIRKYKVNVANTVTLYLEEEGYGCFQAIVARDTGILGVNQYDIVDYNELCSYTLKSLPADFDCLASNEYVIKKEAQDLERIEDSFSNLGIPVVFSSYTSLPSKSVFISNEGYVYAEDMTKTRCALVGDQLPVSLSGSFYNGSILKEASNIKVSDAGLSFSIKNFSCFYWTSCATIQIPKLLHSRINPVEIEIRPSKAYEVFNKLKASKVDTGTIDGKAYSTLKDGLILEVEEACKFFGALKKETEVISCYYYTDIYLLEVPVNNCRYFLATWKPTNK